NYFTDPIYCLAVIVCMSLPFSNASAAGKSTMVLKESANYELNGEEFEVQTWEDLYGQQTLLVPTEVQNKTEVARFVDNLLKKGTAIPNKGSSIRPYGQLYNWTRSDLAGYASNSKDAKLTWSTSGYGEVAYLYPITTHVNAVKAGTLRSTWLGSGNADKIVVSYSYKFNGVTVSLSYPPSLTASSNTVSWTSLPVTSTWYVNSTSEAASAESRTMLTSVDLTATSDIYKGSNIYRPKISFNIPWLGN
ncbi:hypothetical protein, partial [Paenibacillus humicus]|uniref:hypothetical protein n=1 Tax=Paenibacillus humicus TaxID=412861 RepID=UPI003D28EAC8